MLKRIYQIIKKIIISSFLLYGYNMVAVTFGLIVPINYITVGIMSLFGYPTLLAFILIQILIY